MLAVLILMPNARSLAQTPLTGHYPPGQSGIRGASTPQPGWAFTNFNRFFTNIEVKDAHGEPLSDVDELRFANISMVTWTTGWELMSMRYGALAGFPFATGNLRPAGGDSASTGFGLGDILVTPLSLYGVSAHFDYQLQLTLWTPSGRFSPGSKNNRGTGFWALVYSLGGVYYPGGNRDAWSLSAVARIEQNFEQKDTGVDPGDDVVIDWGAGKVFRAGDHAIDAGISGFGAWQLTAQSGGSSQEDVGFYRYFGVGPEASISLTEPLALRARAHWELGARNVVQGNNLWIILNYRW